MINSEIIMSHKSGDGIRLAWQYKLGGRVTTELVDTESDMTADEQLLSQYRMSTYIDQFTDPDAASCEDVGDKPVFLSRCLCHLLTQFTLRVFLKGQLYF